MIAIQTPSRCQSIPSIIRIQEGFLEPEIAANATAVRVQMSSLTVVILQVAASGLWERADPTKNLVAQKP
jgi:hypothetical protein